ncbi:MAG: insulinase family protein [Parcubacteria group bacterium]|nr:insulinase family protein [Parcubacteria group bacterium]
MFTKQKLPTGLRVITAPMKNTKTVTLLIVFGVGSKYESARNAGVSHFLEHMFFKGTKKRPNPKIITEYLEEIGGEYNAFTSKEYTGFYAKVASQHAKRAFDMISDILLHSKLAATDIEREKGVILEEMRMYQDTPMSHVGDVFEECMYGDQPAGRLIIGNEKSITGLKRQDFTDYYKHHYTVSNAVVSVAGDIDGNQAFDLVGQYFKGLPKKAKGRRQPVKEGQRQPAFSLHQKDTDQAHIVLGFRAFDTFDSRKYPLGLLSVILGGGMSSRLFLSVREKLGLAYYISCDNQTYTDSGYLGVHAGLDKSKIEKALQVILAEFTKVRDKGISQKELKKAKEYIKGRTLMGLETSDNYASWLTMQEVLTGKIQTIAEKFAKIEAVTAADIQKVAGQVIKNSKLNLAIVGPYKDEEKFEKLLSV